MKQRSRLITLLITIMGLSSTLLMLSGCNNLDDMGPYSPMIPVLNEQTYIFKDISGIGIEYEFPQFPDEKAQYFKYDGTEQTITLRLASITKPDLPTPDKFQFYLVVNTAPVFYDYGKNHGFFVESQGEGFYHAWTDTENDEPVIKIRLMKNETGKERAFGMYIIADPAIYETTKLNHKAYYGASILIFQSPLTEETETFSLKANFKCNVYQTEASLDEKMKKVSLI